MIFKGISISNRYGNATYGTISKGLGIKECELAFTGGYMQVRSQFLFIPILALFLIGETAYGQNASIAAPSGLKQPSCGSSESKDYEVSALGESRLPRESKEEAIKYALGACRENLKSKASIVAGGNSCKNTCNFSACRGCQLERLNTIEPETFKNSQPTLKKVVRTPTTTGNPIQDVAHVVGGIFGGLNTEYYQARVNCEGTVKVTDICAGCEWFPDDDKGLPRESTKDSQLNHILEDPETAIMCAELASSDRSPEFSLDGL